MDLTMLQHATDRGALVEVEGHRVEGGLTSAKAAKASFATACSAILGEFRASVAPPWSSRKIRPAPPNTRIAFSASRQVHAERAIEYAEAK